MHVEFNRTKNVFKIIYGGNIAFIIVLLQGNFQFISFRFKTLEKKCFDANDKLEHDSYKKESCSYRLDKILSKRRSVKSLLLTVTIECICIVKSYRSGKTLLCI